MHQVQLQLTDQQYDEVKRRAMDAGIESVDEFVTSVLSGELIGWAEDFDHLFTPDRIAHLDKVAASVKASGKTYSIDEASAHLTVRRSEWIRENGR